jgi:hypothetical protein
MIAAVVSFLRGVAAAGGRLSPVACLDLADVLEHGESRTSHRDRADGADRHRDTVRAVRQGYGRSMVGDPDSPYLKYTSGVSRARPSRIVLVDSSGENVRTRGTRLTQSHAHVSTRNFVADTSPAVAGDPQGVGDAPGIVRNTDPQQSSSERDREVRPGRVIPFPAVLEPGSYDLDRRLDCLEWGRKPPRAGSTLGRELRGQARKLLAEAVAVGVLQIEAAYSSVHYLAVGLWRLAARLGGIDPAVRGIRRSILRLQRRRDDPDRFGSSSFPGRAVLFFTRPRSSAAGPWFSAGLRESWPAPAWPDLPDPDEVPGWTPIAPVSALSFGPADPDPEVLESRVSDISRVETIEGEYVARLELATDPVGAGAASLRAVLAGSVAVAAILEGYGPDYIGRIVSWRRRAEAGSETSARDLARLDRIARRWCGPARERRETDHAKRRLRGSEIWNRAQERMFGRVVRPFTSARS